MSRIYKLDDSLKDFWLTKQFDFGNHQAFRVSRNYAVITPTLWKLNGSVKVLIDRGLNYVFYHGERIGQHGKSFTIWKFRTMQMGSDKGNPSVAESDSRVTRIGKILRRYKIDELPQIINIIKGDMALVGPRPEVRHYIEKLPSEARNIILSIKPGITDYASLWNYNEGERLAQFTDPEEGYLKVIRPIKIRLQLRYIEEKCFWVDLKILWKTTLLLLRKIFASS